MADLNDDERLWTPDAHTLAHANLEHYRHWLAQTRGLDLPDYDALWRWSVSEIEPFWESLFDFFDLRWSQRWSTPLVERVMPGAVWFPGVRLNYAENILAKATPVRPAIVHTDESGEVDEWSWSRLTERIARIAQVLRALNVRPGDRVAAYVPNIPDAIAAVLAAASIGAIWSACSPDFGARGVLDRFSQITPKVLIAVTGYAYGGKAFDRRDALNEILAGLPETEHVLLLPFRDVMPPVSARIHDWESMLSQADPSVPIEFEQVAFDHPLWVLYSSGTTGLPKPIVHGHGGMLLEHAKVTALHHDLKPGERFFWYSSTGWMMWNYLIGSLLCGVTIVTYDGSPAHPAPGALFALAERVGIDYLGMSAAYIHACMKAGIVPGKQHDLSRLRALGSTGSPLSTDGFRWVYQHVHPTLALESMSGGTDLCTAVVGGIRTQPIYLGEIQGRALGAAVHAFDAAGQPVVDALGELVITQPMPCMPVRLWGDDAAMTRYRASYFEPFLRVWRHGDWIRINARGGCVIYGRSDATINRQGIRMGTAELYRVVEGFDEISDSLIIDLEMLGHPSQLLLFVVMKPGTPLTDALRSAIISRLKREISPRHVPDIIEQIDAVPYTMSGKKMEVPVRKILLGVQSDEAARESAMRNPEALQTFIDYAARQNRNMS